jgi:hypothetical protein
VLLLSLALPAARAETPWLSYEGPRYTLHSQLSEARTHGWIRQYDQFIETVSQELGIDPAGLAPLSIVIFDDADRFSPYIPRRPDGQRPDSMRGFFARREGWNVVGVIAGSQGAAIDPVVLHEGVHWLLSVDGRSYPAWFSEGAAEYFSTFRVRRAHATWGDLQPGLVRALRGSGGTGLATVIAAHRSGSLFDAAGSTGLFYAQSWALTHYLIQRFGARETFARLRDWMDQDGAADPATVLEKAFGLDPAVVEAAVSRYAQAAMFERGRAQASATPYKVSPRLDRASRAAVEAALGRLALGARFPSLAMDHAEAALRSDPDAPEGHELMALIAKQRRAAPETLASLASVAIAAGSRDALMRVLLADGLKANGLADTAAVARRRAGLYQQAIDLRPALRIAHERLPLVLGDVAAIESQDLTYLALGRQMYPDSGMPLVGFAIVEQRRGATQSAMALIEVALEPVRRLSADQKAEVLGLRAAWLAPRSANPREGVPVGGG